MDERVYGRGALDMKGGLCCALFAAKAIHDAGVRLKGKLLVESVVGEEDGGIGTLATVLRGYKADEAVVVEPTEMFIFHQLLPNQFYARLSKDSNLFDPKSVWRNLA